MADIERWITVNGAHIPIIKGESRARAVSRFIKDKSHKKLSESAKRAGENFSKYQRLTNGRKIDYANKKVTLKDGTEMSLAEYDKKVNSLTKEHQNELDVQRKLGYDTTTGKRSTVIKGFKTREELDRRYNEAYNKGEDLRDSYSERLQPLKDMPNKWDKESDRIHRQYKQAFMSKYKLKASEETPAKRTITGTMTDKVRRANKANKPYIEKYNKYNAQGDAYGQKAEKETRTTSGSDNRYYSARAKQSEAYRKAHNAEQRGYEAYAKVMDSKKKYKYNVADANRQKVVKSLSEKSIKLDRQMSTASGKEFDRLAKEYEKNQRKLNAIGGKYIVGRKKKK